MILLACLSGMLIGAGLGFVLERLWHGGEERARRMAAEARLDEVQASLVVALRDRDAGEARYHEALAAKGAAETAEKLARHDAEGLRTQLQDWEKTRGQLIEAAQAGVLTTAQTISSKLIEDHKRETAAAKEEAERQLKAATEAMRTEVRTLQGGVDVLKGQVAEKGALVDTVWRALTSPGGAGQFAEIGLANTLKSFGLVEGRDFSLQETLYGDVTGKRLRPDAIVFLPGDSVLVIDAKASKHLIELARAEGTAEAGPLRDTLARRMNQHLRDLADRDYAAAILTGWRKAGRSGELARILSVMYLPNEAALERLSEADPNFAQKAADVQIIPAGPAGLAGIIGFASVEIRMMRQIENQKHIIEAAERLLESLAVAVNHVAAVGKGIRQAAEGFHKLTVTVNSRLLPRARNLRQMGFSERVQVPANLGAYQVLDLGAETTIEGEAETLAEEQGGLQLPSS